MEYTRTVQLCSFFVDVMVDISTQFVDVYVFAGREESTGGESHDGQERHQHIRYVCYINLVSQHRSWL